MNTFELKSDRKLHTLRKDNIKKRKNFFPLVFIATTLLALIIYCVITLNPYEPVSILVFLILIFLFFVLIFSFLFLDKKTGAIVSTSITFFIFLRYIELGNVLNLILLTAFTASIIVYKSRK